MKAGVGSACSDQVGTMLAHGPLQLYHRATWTRPALSKVQMQATASEIDMLHIQHGTTQCP